MKRHQILLQELQHRYYKKALVISKDKLEIFDDINSLHKMNVTGFLTVDNPKGAVFDVDSWPFKHKFFDLIILDNALYSHKSSLKDILAQIHFCLTDDGDFVVSSSKGFFMAELVPKTLANGFVVRKLKPVYKAKNIIMKVLTGFATKEFVAFFRKTKSFDINLNPISILEKTAQTKTANSISTNIDCKEKNGRK